MRCVVCRERFADTGVLCDSCSEALDGSTPIWPEQIDVRGKKSTAAAFVDVWGMPHHVDARTSIGRSIEDAKVIVLDPSVSRRHAELVLAAGWTLRDLGSTCGTYVNDRRVDEPTDVRHGDVVRFGEIGMFFVESAPQLEARLDIPTYRLPPPGDAPPPLPELRISLQVPSGGGGGLAIIDDKHVQLTTPQYELLEVLLGRMHEDASKPHDERGFVAVSELLRLSLDVADPTEQHVRQLVYRVRRVLVNAGVGDIIEVRRGVGYRLRAVTKN